MASAELLRRQGYAGTGLKQILAQAEAPFGSLYHFFPGGKEELAEEVIRTGGRFFLELYRAVAREADDFPATVDGFFAGAAATLEATDFADACPIATIAGEIASTHERLRRASADAFQSWLDAVAGDAEAAGVAPAPARQLAQAVLAVLEGAFLLSRTSRSLEPMHAARHAALALVAAALAPG